MKVAENQPLDRLNTFGISARAGMVITVETEEDLLSSPGFNPGRDLVLGGGSNVLFVTDVPGTVYLNRLRGIDIIQQDPTEVLIEVGAGENWHELVTWSVSRDFSGIENLALIPGLAGAAPMQNIGAYGVELASVLDSVTAWDWHTARWVVLSREQCLLGYRSSLFKAAQPDRYMITSVRIKLKKQFTTQLGYAGLAAELEQTCAGEPGLADVYAAVIRLRRRRLPDPAVIGNAGSFFKNPVLPLAAYEQLQARFPQLVSWEAGDNGMKVSAAWLIERCGLKGFAMNGAAVSAQHALVLVSQEHCSGRAIWELAQVVEARVWDAFGIRLEPEPRIFIHAGPSELCGHSPNREAGPDNLA
jgi:UDP-N-acetylmuramate dehydrogenase